MTVTITAPLAPPPQQFTNVSTLINGGYKEAGILLYRNGLLQTEGLDYTRNIGILTMAVPPIPGDLIRARVFVIGKQLGGAYQERYVAPWTLAVTGLFDSASTEYHIVFGPTISGGCDGINRLFQWGCVFPRVQVWLNGVLQTLNVDIATGQTSMVFLTNVAPPQPGDLITLLAYSS